VIDPAQNWNGLADVGVNGGVVTAFGPGLDPAGCSDVRDARGLYLSPGLIDLHGHWYEGGLYGINAEIGLNHGVTTPVDAGTAGFANFPEFRRTTIDHSRANLLAFVHISCLGLHAPFAEELLNMSYAKPVETAAVIDRHRDRAVGVKVRIGAMTGNHGSEALDMALRAAEMVRVPLMVHISTGANEKEVLDRLRPGDILTHCFHGRTNRIFTTDGNGVIPQLKMARERGVWFDIGHGCGSFSWESAQKGFEHHFYPDTLSTDLHRYCVCEPFSLTLPVVMSKFLALGMSLQDVVLKTTWTPARILGKAEKLGHLRPGAQADMMLFEMRTGEFEFLDTHLRSRTGTQLIEPRLVVRNGVVHRPGDFPMNLRELYDCDQVVFDFIKKSA
jgi:dihydroorotase